MADFKPGTNPHYLCVCILVEVDRRSFFNGTYFLGWRWSWGLTPTSTSFVIGDIVNIPFISLELPLVYRSIYFNDFEPQKDGLLAFSNTTLLRGVLIIDKFYTRPGLYFIPEYRVLKDEKFKCPVLRKLFGYDFSLANLAFILAFVQFKLILVKVSVLY